MTNDDWIKVGLGLLGGAGGAIITLVVTSRKNRVQPVKKSLTVYYLDLPTIMKGYTAEISLKGIAEQSEPYFFKKLAIVQLQLINVGNKDIPEFGIGINLPEGNTIIGTQSEGDDRYHVASYSPQISISTPSNHLDFVLKPFNRQDRYLITLIVNSLTNNLINEISLSKVLPVNFVDTDSSLNVLDKAWAALAPLIPSIFIFALCYEMFRDIAPAWLIWITGIFCATMLCYVSYRMRKKF